MKSEADLGVILEHLLSQGEDEVVEFKSGGGGFPTAEIGKYFSALSNEANLRRVEQGWLIFGINDKDRQVCGTDYRNNPARLQGLKNDISNGLEPRASFRNIYEYLHPQGRVILMEVPPAPSGMPIAWQGHFYGRNGESLAPLDLGKREEIRQQSMGED